MHFIWERLHQRHEDLGYVGVYEKPDTELMKMLVDNYTDEPSVVSVAEQLMAKRRAVLDGDGQQYQEYKQKDLSSFAPEEYRGSTIIGRAYTPSLFQRLHSPILNTIYKTTHVGLDINSAFSTMLVNAFGDLDLRFFRVYVESPQVVYDGLARSGLDRGMVKKLVNGTICAWPSSFEDPDVMAELSRVELVQWMREDVGQMAAAVRQRYPLFFEMIKRKCDGEGKSGHVEGTALSYLAADMEHSVMRAIIRHLFSGTQLSDVVWKYDGIIVPMTKVSGRRHEEVVRELRDVVKQQLDIDVVFKVQDLGADSFGICIAPEDRNRDDGLDAYERWKAAFERKFAVLKNPPVFMMFQRGGSMWVDLNAAGFQHVTMTEPKDFIKRWHEDPNKRMYSRRDFVPPPMQAEEGVLNTFRGLAAAALPEVEGVDLGVYMKHVDILVGNLHGEHPDYAEYLHNLLAFKFQRPGLKWRVMPIIVSAQGVGKDTWFDFIATLFGEHCCIKGDGISDFVDKKSGKLEAKLLCCFQEMGKSTADRECQEKLKTYITNKHLALERKHVNEVIVSNVVDFVGFTNKLDAVALASDDRRFCIFTADSTFMQKTEYFYPLLAFFEDDRNKRAVYQFYMERDITGFDPSAARPKTESQRAIAESQIGHLEMFLREAVRTWREAWRLQDETLPFNRRDYAMEGGLLRVAARIVMEHWMEYAKANNFRNHESKNAMSQFYSKLSQEMCIRTDPFKSEGVDKLVFKKKVGGGTSMHFFDYRGIERYLASIFTDDGQDDEPPAKRKRGELKARHNPNPSGRPLYQVLESGDVVFESDDLEDINRELGEAYICPLRGVLVNQSRNNMEIDINDIFEGDHKWAKVEQKFPFYVRDRTG